jgi:hypothetical protein
MVPLSLGRIPGQARKCKSTISEPQPERASAVRRDDDAPRDLEHEAAEDSRDFQDVMRRAAFMTPFSFLETPFSFYQTPFSFFQTHFPEEDGQLEHVIGPFSREICYTQKTEGGEEVAVTVPGEDTWVFQAARRPGEHRTRVNGIKQGGVLCIALSMMPPAFASGETENAGISDAAFDAVEQALLELLKKLQDPDFEGSKPVPDWWLEGCLAMVCVGGKPRVYEYSKAKGLCVPQADTGWMLLKADEELRMQNGVPLQPVLRDAASLSKSTNSQSKAASEPERTDSLERKVFVDGFPGVATPEEFYRSYLEHLTTKAAANDATSLYNLRKRALEIPLAGFQSSFPKEDGFEHDDAGPLARDLHYTELTDGGEKVAVMIPWDNTRIYVVTDLKPGGRITTFALYVLPPAPVASSKPENAEAPCWGRGISDATMTAVSRELEEVIRQVQGPGYNGIQSAGQLLEGCIALVIVGLESRVGVYTEEEGVRWSTRGPVVGPGYGLAAASKLSHW